MKSIPTNLKTFPKPHQLLSRTPDIRWSLGARVEPQLPIQFAFSHLIFCRMVRMESLGKWGRFFFSFFIVFLAEKLIERSVECVLGVKSFKMQNFEFSEKFINFFFDDFQSEFVWFKRRKNKNILNKKNKNFEKKIPNWFFSNFFLYISNFYSNFIEFFLLKNMLNFRKHVEN